MENLSATNIKKRESAIDVIKVLACLLVIGFHFFTDANYYKTLLTGEKLFALTTIRWVFNTCVPLFLIVTGYLLMHYTIKKGYYKRLFRIMYEFTAASLIVALLYFATTGQSIAFIARIKNLLYFNDFVTIYLGLILLSPFINLAYQGIKEKRGKQIFILVLVLLVGVPAILNGTQKNMYAGWTGLYCVAYYVIGGYIAEFRPKIKPVYLLSVITGIAVLHSAIIFISSPDELFRYYTGNYESILTLSMATCIFLLLYNIKINKKWPLTVLKAISECTLSIFLVSDFTDAVADKVIGLTGSFLGNFPKILFVVPLSFMLALPLAMVIRYFYKMIQYFHKKRKSAVIR